MYNAPFYTQQWDDCIEPPEPEENVVTTCDNCEEEIFDCDEMAVVEEHTFDNRTHIKHLCMDCWEKNHWDDAEELLDMIGIWYWTGDAVDAMKIANNRIVESMRARKAALHTAVTTAAQAVAKRGGMGDGARSAV